MSTTNPPPPPYHLLPPPSFPFPYPSPYSIQLDLMRTVFSAIEDGKIAIVSPPPQNTTVAVDGPEIDPGHTPWFIVRVCFVGISFHSDRITDRDRKIVDLAHSDDIVAESGSKEATGRRG
jgi:Rad3-related DNA helicase